MPVDPSQRVLFITGKLAEPALRRVVDGLIRDVGIDAEVAVLGITAAALMHAEWVGKRLAEQSLDLTRFDRVLLPGWCQGDIGALSRRFGEKFERGPKDLFDLPEFFGHADRRDVDMSTYDIEILAEINHAPRMSDAEIIEMAGHFRESGADVIDLGCIPGESWSRIDDVVGLLRKDGFRVSVDSFDQTEVEAAVEAGAELVLSCNAANREWASQLDAELVAIPDDPRDLESLDATIAYLTERGCRFRIDPILEPIGFGFAASLARYYDVRNRYPDLEVMMGIGNLTELTEADTAGMNALLAGLCQELGIRSVLTTEVINWARSAVAEFDIARRMMKYSIENAVLPKHLHGELVALRDPKLTHIGEAGLTDLAAGITDRNFRILVDGGKIHVLNKDGHWRGTDPYALFDEFVKVAEPLESAHAFYLGYELAKARTALTLGKRYIQDEALRWGLLTVDEVSARERRKREANG